MCWITKWNAGISVSDLTVTLNFEESFNFDATAWWDPLRGRNSCWYFSGFFFFFFFFLGGGGVAVERSCGRHLKNSYNACKKSWGSQAKMVSKCNRIASLVILNYKIFLGEVPRTPLTRGGSTPSRPLPPLPSTLGEHQRCSMAVPLSKNRRRPW